MNDRPPKVLMVLNDMAWFWSHRLPLAEAILDRGWRLDLATAGAKGYPGLRDMGVRGRDIVNHGKGINPLTELRILWSVCKAIRESRADLIHAITLRHAFYAGVMARLCGRKKIVFTLAGLGSLFSGGGILKIFLLPFFRFAFRHKGAYVIFQNPDDRAALERAGITDPERSVLIRSSGVDLTEFSAAPMPEEETPVVLFSSRLIREKGIEEFVEAARMLKGRARFQVAGGIYEKNPGALSQEQMRAWHDDGTIEWLGQVENMPKIYKACSLYVLPSYYREGVPKSTIEAMATARPVITCNTPGCRETVEDGVNGRFVPPRDSPALAQAIDALLNDRALMEKMGRAGRAKAEKDFDVQDVVRRTLDVYDRALKA